MTRTLVEGFAPDAIALARLLAAEGDEVHLLGTDPPPGLELEVVTTLPDEVDVAYLDVWTAEVDDRVRRLRRCGARLSCLSDLLLERAAIPTIGVTGTAGKSTTASFVAQLLRAIPGRGPVLASTTARSGNLWATEESLAVLSADQGVHVLELTSSHLAFMHTSPHVAVVTSFSPDHLELHGSLEAYRRAKEQIVRQQGVGDHAVVNADDPLAEAFARLTAGTVHRFSTHRPVERGVTVRSGRAWATGGGGVGIDLGAVMNGVHGQAAVAAAAAAIASGVAPEALAGRLEQLQPPPGRAREVGRIERTVLIDDGMAATPAKTRATVRRFGSGELVLVCGGALDVVGREVHASVEERAELDATLDEVARVAVLVVCFGPAGERIADALLAREVRVERVGALSEAIALALARAHATAATALVVSPMYPLDPAERSQIAEQLVHGGRE